MRIIRGAQPIRSYGPPSWMVWTAGDPFGDEECAALNRALEHGEVEVVERGRWGRYNVIVCWRNPEHPPLFCLAELGDPESS